MQYLVIARDYPHALEKRMQHREAHLAGAQKMKEQGQLIYAVAMIEEGKMVGSVMVFDFESEGELKTWKQNEPYLLGQVWETVEITECAVPPLFQ